MIQRIMIAAVLLFAATAATAEGPVNINQASAEQLAAMLDGVGASRAEAIVAYREENGEFGSVEELVAVSGIGEATLSVNRELLTVGGQ